MQRLAGFNAINEMVQDDRRGSAGGLLSHGSERLDQRKACFQRRGQFSDHGGDLRPFHGRPPLDLPGFRVGCGYGAGGALSGRRSHD